MNQHRFIWLFSITHSEHLDTWTRQIKHSTSPGFILLISNQPAGAVPRVIILGTQYLLRQQSRCYCDTMGRLQSAMALGRPMHGPTKPGIKIAFSRLLE